VRTVVHFAPHPDDELLGAPVSLFALRDLEWRVVNVAVTLGRPEQEERRLAEVREACARAGFELRVDGAEPAGVLRELRPDLVVCPSPHDHHPTHERVGRDVLAAVRAAGAPSRVWLWAIYADLGLPTLVRGCSPERLREIEHALEAHEGELTRNDVRQMLRARAQLNTVLAGERVFGFGSPGMQLPGAELLTEVAVADGRFLLCEPRLADRDELGAAGEADVTDWLFQPSLTTQFGSRHC
jgi:LmbE family N-acetylglucosaminyl deacetylase